MQEYHLILISAYFVLGLLIGSFLNVVIYRHGSGVGLRGRSKCLSCGKTLTARMLLPLFSFLLQRGRCAHCSSRLSFQYPLVEFCTGLLFVVVFIVRGFDPLQFDIEALLLTLLDFAIWSTLLLMVVYDLKHKIIPDRFSLLFALLSLASLSLRSVWGVALPPFVPLLEETPAWLDFAAGPLLALPFALLWLLSGGRAMGLGDAKIAWGMGWFFGFTSGVSAIFFSFWVAFFPSLILLLIPRKRFTMKSEIPFAPFLVLGTLIIYLCHVDIFMWTL